VHLSRDRAGRHRSLIYLHCHIRRGRGVAAGQPDAGTTVRIGWEVAPGGNEGCARRPRVAIGVVDIHFIGGIRCVSTATHDPHQAIDVKRSRLRRRPRYAGDGGDSVRHGIEHKGVSIVMNSGAVPVTASGRIYLVAYRRGWYVAQLRRQDGRLLHPGVRCRA